MMMKQKATIHIYIYNLDSFLRTKVPRSELFEPEKIEDSNLSQLSHGRQLQLK